MSGYLTGRPKAVRPLSTLRRHGFFRRHHEIASENPIAERDAQPLHDGVGCHCERFAAALALAEARVRALSL